MPSPEAVPGPRQAGGQKGLGHIWGRRALKRPSGLMAATRAAAGPDATTDALLAAAGRDGCGASNTGELADVGCEEVVCVVPRANKLCDARATVEQMTAFFRDHVTRAMAAGGAEECRERWLRAATTAMWADAEGGDFATRLSAALADEATRASPGLATLLSPAAEGRPCFVLRRVINLLHPLLEPLYLEFFSLAVHVDYLRLVRRGLQRGRGRAWACGRAGGGGTCVRRMRGRAPALAAALALAAGAGGACNV